MFPNVIINNTFVVKALDTIDHNSQLLSSIVSIIVCINLPFAALASLAQCLLCEPVGLRVVGSVLIKGMYLSGNSIPGPGSGHAGGKQ